MREKIKAVAIVQATPLNRNDSLDLDGLKANTEFLLERAKGKRVVLVPTGSTAEAYALSDQDRLRVIETVLLNLVTLEDLCVDGGKVTGVVVNRTTISGALPVDPIVLQADTVIDGSGHEAVAVDRLRARNLRASHLASAGSGEGPMDATAGEPFVVERVAEVYPGLLVTGMAVCATFGGSRKEWPVFGGTLQSGKGVAELILEKK
jgi:ribulose 1,5-bisphosphate synthetase/thiazole synthase